MKKIETTHAPKAIGPYSQAIRVGSLLFISGQIPLHPETSQMVEPKIELQTERVFLNLKAILNEAGLDFQHVVRAEVFLKDMNHFGIVNEIYGKYFHHDPKPARQAVEVARLPKEALVEISCIATFEK